jgi:23S rRNA (adenine2030-N6)-methyltransferase
VEAAALRANFAGDGRVVVHERDGYAAIRALLPPRHGTLRYARGLVLVDPPYEAQLDEFDAALAALGDILARWPQATVALWYPVKVRRALQPFLRKAARLPAKSALVAELMVRPDDSPLRMNGSGLLLLNAPWKLDAALAPALRALGDALGEAGASTRLEWLRPPA